MNNFYVYAYFDPRKPGDFRFRDLKFSFQPFYIGKGSSKRSKEHILPYMLRQKSIKASKIKAIIKDTGKLPLHERIYENITEQEAFDIEKAMIAHFGRLDTGSGILANHTDGGEGQSGTKGTKKPKLWRKVHQYTLDGSLVKSWDCIADIANELKIEPGNISTAIKRKGTCGNHIWSYEFLGAKIEAKEKWSMPTKYSVIQKTLENKIVNTFSSALEAEKALGLRKGARNKILECARGKVRSYKGYLWEAKEHEG